MLEPIRARRKEWEQKIEEVYAILEEGTRKARATAAETLNDVRNAMRINYFADKELIAEQAERFRQSI
jgi:tryptophanyl-tRNA synthetase